MLFRPKTQQIYIFADWQNKLFFNFSNSSYGRVALSQKLVCSKNNRYEKKLKILRSFQVRLYQSLTLLDIPVFTSWLHSSFGLHFHDRYDELDHPDFSPGKSRKESLEETLEETRWRGCRLPKMERKWKMIQMVGQLFLTQGFLTLNQVPCHLKATANIPVTHLW
jgi:hypothetical protein